MQTNFPDDVLKAAYDAALSYRHGQACDPIHYDAALQEVIAEAIMADRAALLSTAEPVAWAWKGPKGGFLADDKKPSWPSTPLYAAPPAPSVAVKALEWHGHGDYHRADSILGAYHVRFGYDEGRRPEFLTPYSINWKWRDEDKTITDAKAAAQADYEARIRSVLA